MDTYKLISQLRIVGILEGISFIVLLFIAMPLKYMAGMPLAVTIAGSTHGLLFILYVAATMRAAGEFDWSMKKRAQVLVAAVIPFGTFVLDGKLKEEEHAVKSQKELVTSGASH